MNGVRCSSPPTAVSENGERCLAIPSWQLLSLCSGAYTAEVMRGGLAAVPKGAIEAARALGLSSIKVFFLVTAPIAVRRALPAYSNEIVVSLKATSLASTITVMELTGVAKDLMSETFAVIQVFCMVAAIYLVINSALILGLRLLEIYLAPPHERPLRHQRGRNRKAEVRSADA